MARTFTPTLERIFIGRPRDADGHRTSTSRPSARELFPVLRDRMLASRPVVGHTPEVWHATKVPNGQHTKTGGRPIYGKPTFQNRIDEDGNLV